MGVNNETLLGYGKLTLAIVIPNAGAYLASKQMKDSLKNWYPKLKFPPCRPPNWVFPPVWTTLFTTMGTASYMVYNAGGGGGFNETNRLALMAYGTQLALNWAYTPIFFGLRDIKKGFMAILALDSAALTCGLMFYKVNKTAGLMFIPYIAWLSFATYLNYCLLKLNPQDKNVD